MTRQEFLSQLGLGAAFVLTSTCLSRCTSESLGEDSQPQREVDFTLDLNEPANAELLKDGGYVIKNQIVVARTMNGQYVAATQICSHEGNPNVIFRNNEFQCTVHGARFALNGTGLNANGSRGLKIYKTELNTMLLRVFS